MKLGFFIVLIVYFLPKFVTAQGRRIYIANDDHTDYMWSANAETYANVFVEMIDWHMALANQTSGNEWAYRNRFIIFGYFQQAATANLSIEATLIAVAVLSVYIEPPITHLSSRLSRSIL